MSSKFGDCTYKEFIALCALRRFSDVERTRWVDLFERAAGAAAVRVTPQEEAKLTAFITEGRKPLLINQLMVDRHDKSDARVA